MRVQAVRAQVGERDGSETEGVPSVQVVSVGQSEAGGEVRVYTATTGDRFWCPCLHPIFDKMTDARRAKMEKRMIENAEMLTPSVLASVDPLRIPDEVE